MISCQGLVIQQIASRWGMYGRARCPPHRSFTRVV